MITLAKIQAAGQRGQLLPSAVENLTAWLGAGLPAWAEAMAALRRYEGRNYSRKTVRVQTVADPTSFVPVLSPALSA